jgi:hypothetical protein
MSVPYTDSIKVLDAVTATVANTAAPGYDVSKRQLKSIQFVCSGHSSGNGAFGIEVSNDGDNWVVYNRLITNATGDNTKTDAKTAAPTLSTNVSSIHFFPAGDLFRFIRVFVTVTTDGAYSAILQTGG